MKLLTNIRRFVYRDGCTTQEKDFLVDASSAALGCLTDYNLVRCIIHAEANDNTADKVVSNIVDGSLYFSYLPGYIGAPLFHTDQPRF